MDTIDFIEKDIQRDRGARSTAVMYAIPLVLLPAVLGISLRDSYRDIFDLRTFLPNAMAALSLVLFPLYYRKRNSSKSRALSGVSLGLSLALFLAIERVFFPPEMRTIYSSSAAFWHESSICFTKGALTVVLIGILLSHFLFKSASWPSRRWRLLAALSSGISGTVMLGFHCDSSSLPHVLLGHIGPGILVGVLLFILFETIFFLNLHHAFPELSKKISNFRKIG